MSITIERLPAVTNFCFPFRAPLSAGRAGHDDRDGADKRKADSNDERIAPGGFGHAREGLRRREETA